nr:LysR substrate-binding domain-containing protein [Paenibacillus sp. 32O-W]
MPIVQPGICALPVLNEEVYLAVPSGDRLAERDSICLSEVAHEPFIGYKEGYPFRKMNDAFCRAAGF